MSLVLRTAGLLPRAWIRKIGALRFRNPAFRRLLEFATRQFQNADGVIQRGIGQGLRFNTGTSAAGYLLGTSEPDMQRTLELFTKPGMTVFDIGANVGFFTVLAAHRVGPAGKVVSFEPLESNAGWIRHNLALNGFSRHAVRVEAIAAENATAEFIVSRTNTLGRLSATGVPSEESGRVTVPVRTLDALLAEGAIDLPSLIKIDIEGSEVDCLRGARALIGRAQPILLIEMHGTNAAMTQELASLGYVARAFGQTAAKPIVDCGWNAQILAVPAARQDALALL